METALGLPLADLEKEWLVDTFGRNANGVALQELLPWFVLLSVVMLAPLAMMPPPA